MTSVYSELSGYTRNNNDDDDYYDFGFYSDFCCLSSSLKIKRERKNILKIYEYYACIYFYKICKITKRIQKNYNTDDSCILFYRAFISQKKYNIDARLCAHVYLLKA